MVRQRVVVARYQSVGERWQGGKGRVGGSERKRRRKCLELHGKNIKQGKRRNHDNKKRCRIVEIPLECPRFNYGW